MGVVVRCVHRRCRTQSKRHRTFKQNPDGDFRLRDEGFQRCQNDGDSVRMTEGRVDMYVRMRRKHVNEFKLLMSLDDLLSVNY